MQIRAWWRKSSKTNSNLRSLDKKSTCCYSSLAWEWKKRVGDTGFLSSWRVPDSSKEFKTCGQIVCDQGTYRYHGAEAGVKWRPISLSRSSPSLFWPWGDLTFIHLSQKLNICATLKSKKNSFVFNHLYIPTREYKKQSRIFCSFRNITLDEFDTN